MKKALIAVGALLLAVYVAGAMALAGRYPPRAEANGEPIGLMTPAEAALALEGRTAAKQVTFTSKDGTSEKMSYGDMGIVRASEGRLALDVAPSSLKWPAYLFKPASYALDPELSCDRKALEEALGRLRVVRTGLTMPKDSEVVKLADGSYGITPEVEGNAVNVSKLADAVMSAVSSGGSSVDLVASDCYYRPGLARTDSGLLALVGMMSAPQNMKISLDAGGGLVEDMDQGLIRPCFTVENNHAAMDPAGIEAAVAALAEKYDTYGTSRQFLTSSGKTVTVSPMSEEIGPCDFGGWKMDRDAMAEILSEKLAAGEDCTLEIPWEYKGVSRGELNDFGDTYLEISIPEQHMWLYDRGKCIVDTDVVTGMGTDPDRATPPGIYKTTDFYTEWTMRGEDYTAFCHYFVRLTLTGVGVHDSGRSAWGGTIYMNNGSHGCINTPYAKVKPIFEFLYDRQYSGEYRHTPVIVWDD